MQSLCGRNIYQPMFTVAIFMIAKKWRQLQHLSPDGKIKEMWNKSPM